MIRSLLPAPVLSVVLLLTWLLLNRSVSAGQLLLGGLIALAIPVITQGLRPTATRVRAPWVALKLFFVVSWDVLLSNLHVAAALLRPPGRMPNGGFIIVPLDTRNGNVMASMAIIMTLAPGTVWSELALDGSAVLVHIFDEADLDTMGARIKSRYEKPLMEIFE